MHLVTGDVKKQNKTNSKLLDRESIQESSQDICQELIDSTKNKAKLHAASISLFDKRNFTTSGQSKRYKLFLVWFQMKDDCHD